MFKARDHVKRNEKPEEYPSAMTDNLIDAEVLEVSKDNSAIRIKCIRFLDGKKDYVGFSFWVPADYFDYADSCSPVSGLVSSYMINGQEYTNEQFIADCKRFAREFPNDTNIGLSHAMEDVLIVYQWAQQHPFISNLDHYAEEFGWTEEQKEDIQNNCPICFLGSTTFCPRFRSCSICRKWWKQEWKGGKA